MQASAPGNRDDPQDGHADGVDGGLEGEGGTGRMGREGDDATGAAATGREATPAPTGAGTGEGMTTGTEALPAGGRNGGTMNGFWQTGQRTLLPAALSGTCIDR
jgi:hypothetical protein